MATARTLLLALVGFAASAQCLSLQTRPVASPRPTLARPAAPVAQAPPNPALVLAPLLTSAPLAAFAEESAALSQNGYSNVSFYFTLVLYILSFPGLYSLVTRSVKSKVVRRTYEVIGPAAEGGRPVRETAGDIVAFFQANNYRIADASDVIVFEGTQAGQNGKAAFLTFCTFIGLGSVRRRGDRTVGHRLMLPLPLLTRLPPAPPRPSARAPAAASSRWC